MLRAFKRGIFSSADATHNQPMSTPVHPRGASLHLGLNRVDPKHYAGWSGALGACEADARDMAALCQSQGLNPKVLLSAQATRAALAEALATAARALRWGDLFVLTFSGHGGQVPDASKDEPDGQDETWCLFDGQLLDDELYAALATFAAGVRVLVLSDSCHSGTVVRAAPPLTADARQRPRHLPPEVARRTYAEHAAFYDGLQRQAPGRDVDPDAALARVTKPGRVAAVVKRFRPSVVLIAGCQDNQTSLDGERNGAFTAALLATWNQGAFRGNHTQFHARIRARMPATQSPNLFTLGPAAAFLAQSPFTL